MRKIGYRWTMSQLEAGVQCQETTSPSLFSSAVIFLHRAGNFIAYNPQTFLPSQFQYEKETGYLSTVIAGKIAGTGSHWNS